VREREAIRLRRESGSAPPWTNDQVLRTYRFTNVSRTLDRMTLTLAKDLHDYDPREQVRRIVTFRLFNRLETWEAMKPHFWRYDLMSLAVEKLAARGPTCSGVWVTGGSMNWKGWPMWKAQMQASILATECCGRISKLGTLIDVFKALGNLERVGPFLANEMLMDIVYLTKILDQACDRKTFVNIGPGSVRGLRMLQGRRVGVGSNYAPLYLVADCHDMGVFRDVVAMFKKGTKLERRLTIHDVEHCLCEYDKFERASSGQSLKNKFKPKMEE
jgi:hypothetical protein